jgi:hypothetical protein
VTALGSRRSTRQINRDSSERRGVVAAVAKFKIGLKPFGGAKSDKPVTDLWW